MGLRDSSGIESGGMSGTISHPRSRLQDQCSAVGSHGGRPGTPAIFQSGSTLVSLHSVSGVPRMRFPLSLLLAAAAGCGQKAPTPDAAPSASSLTATVDDDGALAGPVLEQLAASPYLYLRLKTSRGELWAAIPEAKVETGAVVTVVNPILMTKFASTSLNRTFDVVYFGTLASEGAATAAPSGNLHAGVPQSAATVAVGKVEKATGADARTVSEIWAQRAILEGKPVTLRGVVVKANIGVMGKNWIHLQDGRSEEHTSELQSQSNLVCRLLLEKN